MMDDESNELLKQFVENARFPIPPNYSLSLPVMATKDRKRLIKSLVPFKNARKMLLRLEEKLKLPIRVLNIASQRRADLVSVNAYN